MKKIIVYNNWIFIEYPDFIGLEDVSSEDNLKKLIVYSPAANTSSSISILRASLANHPNITIHNQILDTHLYIFSHWVLDIMKDLPEPKSLRVSLIPKLLELQNDPGKINKLILINNIFIFIYLLFRFFWYSKRSFRGFIKSC